LPARVYGSYPPICGNFFMSFLWGFMLDLYVVSVSSPSLTRSPTIVSVVTSVSYCIPRLRLSTLIGSCIDNSRAHHVFIELYMLLVCHRNINGTRARSETSLLFTGSDTKRDKIFIFQVMARDSTRIRQHLTRIRYSNFRKRKTAPQDLIYTITKRRNEERERKI